MLKNEIWNEIVKFYDLNAYEEKAFEAFKKTNFGFRKNFTDKDEYHLYLCTTCMEKALNRKLLKSDLIGENIPFNEDFEKYYFK